MESLRKQIRNIILENFEPVTSFSTKIENSVSLYGLQKSEIGIQYGLETKSDLEDESQLIVDWEVEFDAREYGIKDFDVRIKNVRGVILVKPNPESDEIVEIPFNAEELRFKINNNIEIKNHSAIYPTDIEIDFQRKEIEVS